MDNQSRKKNLGWFKSVLIRPFLKRNGKVYPFWISAIIGMLFVSLSLAYPALFESSREILNKFCKGEISAIQKALSRIISEQTNIFTANKAGTKIGEKKAAARIKEMPAGASAAASVIKDGVRVRTVTGLKGKMLSPKESAISAEAIDKEKIVVVDYKTAESESEEAAKDKTDNLKVVEDPYYLAEKEEQKAAESEGAGKDTKEGAAEIAVQPMQDETVVAEKSVAIPGNVATSAIILSGGSIVSQPKDCSFDISQYAYSETKIGLPGKILYLSKGKTVATVYEFTLDGKRERGLFNVPKEAISPVFSMDTSRIFYALNSKLYITDENDMSRVSTKTLGDIDTNVLSFSLSSQNDEIAFCLEKERGASLDVYIMDLSSSEIRRITNGERKYYAVQWAPSKDKLIAVGGDAGGKSIFIIDTATGTSSKIPTMFRDITSALYSPDCRKIAFSARVSGGEDIFIMNSNGEGVERLTYPDSNDTNPVWSPDGNNIAFISDIDGNFDIYVVNLEDRKKEKITETNPNGVVSLFWAKDPSAEKGQISKVTDLSVKSSDGISVTLTWSAPARSGLDGKSIYYDVRYSNSEITEDNWSEARCAKNEPIPGVAGNKEAFRVGPLLSGTQYFFVIRAYDKSGYVLSDISNVVNGTTLLSTDAIVPDPPSGIRATAIEGYAIKIEWNLSPSDDVVGYVIYRTDDKGNTATIAVVDAYTTNYVSRYLSEGKTYTFFLRAYDEMANYSADSNSASAMVSNNPPIPPYNFRAAEEDEKGITLRWDQTHLPATAKILLYGKLSGENEYKKIVELGGDATEYKDTKPPMGIISHYKATTLSDKKMESAYSNEVYGIKGIPECERVLIIANSNSSDSLDVAEYYKFSRAIPDENILCLPISEADKISEAKYAQEIETPLKYYLSNTRDADGIYLKDKILFIVTVYGAPYKYVDGDNNLSSVDARIQKLYGYSPEFEGEDRFTTDKEGYIVSRLDGKSADVVKSIVDKTVYAERYLDLTKTTAYFDDLGSGGLSEDVGIAAFYASQAGLPVVRIEDLYSDLGPQSDFKAGDCKDAILYYGWQSGYAEGVFDWRPGAVGCAIPSDANVGKELDFRTESTWISAALAGDITAAIGFVSENRQENSFSDFVDAFLKGHNFGESSVLALQDINLIRVGDPLYSLAKPRTGPPEPKIESLTAELDIAKEIIHFAWKTDIPACSKLIYGKSREYVDGAEFSDPGHDVLTAKEHELSMSIRSMGLDLFTTPFFYYKIAGKGPDEKYFSSETKEFNLAGSIFGRVVQEWRTDYSGEEVTFRLSKPGEDRQASECVDPANDVNTAKGDLQIRLSPEGLYVINGILPGTYDLAMKMSGALMAIKKDIDIGQGEDLTGIDFPDAAGGDVTGNNVIDQHDEEMLQALMGARVGDVNYDVSADLNRDGVIDENDLDILRENMGRVGDGGELRLPPYIYPLGADIHVNEKDLVSITVRAFDPNSDEITLAAVGLPAGAVFTDNGNETGTFSWTPDYSQGKNYKLEQAYAITFKAADGNNPPVEKKINIYVKDIYNPVVITGFQDRPTVNESQNLTTVTIAAVGYPGPVSNPSNIRVNVTVDKGQLTDWQKKEMETATFTVTFPSYKTSVVVNWKPGVHAAGEYPIRFTFDDGVQSVTKEMDITVNDVPLAPVIPLGPSYLVKDFNCAFPASMPSKCLTRYKNYLLASPTQSSPLDNKPDIVVFDATDPSALKYKAQYFIYPANDPDPNNPDDCTYYAATVYATAVQGDYLYLYRYVNELYDPAGEDLPISGYLTILDISDIANDNIVKVASFPYTRMTTCNKVCINDGFVFLVGSLRNKFAIIDARDPADIKEIYYQTIAIPYPTTNSLDAYVYNTSIGGTTKTLAYVTMGANGLHVYDLSNVSSVTNIATYKTTSNNFLTGVYVNDAYIYLLINRPGCHGVKMVSMRFDVALEQYVFDEIADYIIENTNRVSTLSSITQMFVDKNMIYLMMTGNAAAKHGIYVLQFAGPSGGLVYSSQLQGGTRASAQAALDRDRMLLFNLQVLTSATMYLDVIQVGMPKFGDNYGNAFFMIDNSYTGGIKARVYDPDKEPQELSVSVESLSPLFTYGFDKDKEILTIEPLSSDAYANFTKFYICAYDGLATTRREVWVAPRGTSIISVTSPANGSAVSDAGSVTVKGSVDPAIVTVQMRVADFGTYPTWQDVTLTNNAFNHPLEIPTSGSAIIEIKATDAAGNDAPIKYVFIKIMPLPVISGTSPANGSAVSSTGSVIVQGSVDYSTLVTVQMRVTNFGTYPNWQVASVGRIGQTTTYNFISNLPIPIPTTEPGSTVIEAVIEIKATDASGNVSPITYVPITITIPEE